MFARFWLVANAQWLNYPTANVPRLPNGQPDLAAPAPRTADKKPDFSGIWELEHPPCTGGCTDYVGGREFLNLGAKLAAGLPYTPAVAQMVRERSEQLVRDDPVA